MEENCEKQTCLPSSLLIWRGRIHPESSLKQKDRELDRKQKLLLNPDQCSFSESMRGLYLSVLICSLLLGFRCHAGAEKTDAAAESEGRGEAREKRSLPYWNLWSSDFFGWVEELRAQAAYDQIQDLARTFWAHFPIATELGYDSPDSEAQPEE